jgi:hypothetical protein
MIVSGTIWLAAHTTPPQLPPLVAAPRLTARRFASLLSAYLDPGGWEDGRILRAGQGLRNGQRAAKDARARFRSSTRDPLRHTLHTPAWAHASSRHQQAWCDTSSNPSVCKKLYSTDKHASACQHSFVTLVTSYSTDKHASAFQHSLTHKSS